MTQLPCPRSHRFGQHLHQIPPSSSASEALDSTTEAPPSCPSCLQLRACVFFGKSSAEVFKRRRTTEAATPKSSFGSVNKRVSLPACPSPPIFKSSCRQQHQAKQHRPRAAVLVNRTCSLLPFVDQQRPCSFHRGHLHFGLSPSGQQTSVEDHRSTPRSLHRIEAHEDRSQ